MFWQNYALLCSENDMTPNAVCATLGLSSATATHWKNGRIPNGETLSAIADFFGVTIDYLLGRTNVRTPATETAQPLTDSARSKLYDELNQLSASDLDELLVFAQFLRYKHGLSKP